MVRVKVMAMVRVKVRVKVRVRVSVTKLATPCYICKGVKGYHALRDRILCNQFLFSPISEVVLSIGSVTCKSL